MQAERFKLTSPGHAYFKALLFTPRHMASLTGPLPLATPPWTKPGLKLCSLLVSQETGSIRELTQLHGLNYYLLRDNLHLQLFAKMISFT